MDGRPLASEEDSGDCSEFGHSTDSRIKSSCFQVLRRPPPHPCREGALQLCHRLSESERLPPPRHACTAGASRLVCTAVRGTPKRLPGPLDSGEVSLEKEEAGDATAVRRPSAEASLAEVAFLLERRRAATERRICVAPIATKGRSGAAAETNVSQRERGPQQQQPRLLKGRPLAFLFRETHSRRLVVDEGQKTRPSAGEETRVRSRRSATPLVGQNLSTNATCREAPPQREHCWLCPSLLQLFCREETLRTLSPRLRR